MRTFILSLFASVSLMSCKKICPEGTITAVNASFDTVHRVKVDGVVHAILYPGQRIDIEVPEGTHTLEFADANNEGRGCEPVIVNVDPCGIESRSCSN